MCTMAGDCDKALLVLIHYIADRIFKSSCNKCYLLFPTGFRRQYNNENATLEVRKVPQEFNNIAKLNEHFGKFGTLVNVQVQCTK